MEVIGSGVEVSLLVGSMVESIEVVIESGGVGLGC